MPLEYPDQTYIPSSKVQFIVRLEEFSPDILKGKAPTVPSRNLDGNKPPRDTLQVVKSTTPEGATVFELVGKTQIGATKGSGASQTKSSDDLTQTIDGVIPKTADWKQNGIRTPDTLSLTIKYTDMPLDPRVIRSCAVKFYLGTVTPEDYAQGIHGIARASVVGSGVPHSAEPLNLVADADSQGRSNLRFEGWVDKWKMVWNEAEPLITLECVDNTRMMIDQQAAPKLALNGKKPIDEAVADYIANYPQLEGMTVEYRPTTVRDEKTPPRLEKILANTAFRPNVGPPISKGGGSTGGEQFSLWDYLTDIIGSIGHGIRIEGTQIIIQQSTSLYDGRASARSDDPYVERNLPSGQYPLRTFIYGRNILELEIAREYTRKKVTNVEVRCYTPRRKNMLVGRFPRKNDRVTNANPGDGKTDEKWTVVRAPPGIEDQETLNRIAENYFNNVGRQEILIGLKTKNLASFGGGNEDPDLLGMKPGDSFELLVDRERTFNAMTEIERKMSAQGLAEQFLGQLGYSKEFATAYAKAYTNAGFQRIFRMKEMSVTWDCDQGVSFDVVGMNYVEIRVDRPANTNPDPTAPK